MRIFLFFVIIMFLCGCSTVEVAKEVTKATKSIKTSVDKIINSFEEEKEIVQNEKENEKKLVLEQKKIVKINFLDMTLRDIKTSLGEPALSRIDGDTYFVRFDKDNCRLFFFLNTKNINKKI